MAEGTGACHTSLEFSSSDPLKVGPENQTLPSCPLTLTVAMHTSVHTQ